jgi:hypothetical protein
VADIVLFPKEIIDNPPVKVWRQHFDGCPPRLPGENTNDGEYHDIENMVDRMADPDAVFREKGAVREGIEPVEGVFSKEIVPEVMEVESDLRE